MKINGVPQPRRHKNLGAKEIPPNHQRRQPSHHTDDTGGGGRKNSGCLLVLIGLASAPLAGDLLLAAS